MLCLVTQLCPPLCNPMYCSPPGYSVHGDSLGKNIRVSGHALLQGIFPTQGSNLGLSHGSQILYYINHPESPDESRYKQGFVVVQLPSYVLFFVTPWAANIRLPCPLPIPEACSNSCPLSQ